MIIKLNHEYNSRYGVPTIKYIDDAIFNQRSFCSLNCVGDNCDDYCCIRGEDVSIVEYDRIMRHKTDLQSRIFPMQLEDCFTNIFIDDEDYSGGQYTRTKVVKGTCVFHNSKERCILHSVALTLGMDFREIKPISGSLFPITFCYGLLRPSNEVLFNLDDCVSQGITLYQSARNDLHYYFGKDFICELDAMENVKCLIVN